jgi:hypothetical protein
MGLHPTWFAYQLKPIEQNSARRRHAVSAASDAELQNSSCSNGRSSGCRGRQQTYGCQVDSGTPAGGAQLGATSLKSGWLVAARGRAWLIADVLLFARARRRRTIVRWAHSLQRSAAPLTDNRAPQAVTVRVRPVPAADVTLSYYRLIRGRRKQLTRATKT